MLKYHYLRRRTTKEIVVKYHYFDIDSLIDDFNVPENKHCYLRLSITVLDTEYCKLYNKIVVNYHYLDIGCLRMKKKKSATLHGKNIITVKNFNRLYMPTLDLFSGAYMTSAYSLPESRVLLEIYANDGCKGSYVAKRIGADKSNVAKIIRNYVKEGFVTRLECPTDKRAYELHLTEKGKTRAEEFIRLADESITKKIEYLSKENTETLLKAFDTISTVMKSTIV